MKQKYFIKTFGCQANEADSERLETVLKSRGMIKAQCEEDADYLVINTCMVRESAENRVYGLARNLGINRQKNGKPKKIVVTGCMVGAANRDKSLKRSIRKRLPQVDKFLPISEVGFEVVPERLHKSRALVPISNGCNNYCSFCIVPYTRGKEISRPYEDIIKECLKVKEGGYEEVMLIGQNVNSYGADLVKNLKIKTKLKPVMVKHLGRYRIPTLFPHLLKEIANMDFEEVNFMSSNPWDFSDELIDVIANHENITRLIHLPVQSGDNKILKRMNRWYTAEGYLKLIKKIRNKVENVEFTTDIIVGFPEETEAAFENTVKLCKKAKFDLAYIARYSPRDLTASKKTMDDNVPHDVKKKRWEILDELINQKD